MLIIIIILIVLPKKYIVGGYYRNYSYKNIIKILGIPFLYKTI